MYKPEETTYECPHCFKEVYPDFNADNYVWENNVFGWMRTRCPICDKPVLVKCYPTYAFELLEIGDEHESFE